MVSLLIDFKNIIDTRKHDFLLEKIKPVPKTNFQLGLFLVIPETQLKKLDAINKGCEKITYLNTQSFVKSIEGYNYIIINKEMCEITTPKDDFIHLIVQTIQSNFKDVTEILVSIPVKNKRLIQKYSENQFGNPYIHHKNICLVRQPYNITKTSPNYIKYIVKHTEMNYCTISVQLSDNSINYLKTLCNNIDSQKEIAGNMYVKKIDNNLIHTVEINNKSIIQGDDFGVDIVEGLYNFHSHPINAYKKYNVKLGWPSGQDYVGFLLASIEDGTVFHMVITIEGIYIITLTKDSAVSNFLDKKIGEFIKKNYNFCYKEGNTILWYLNKVNSIKYKNKLLFNVQFLYWTDANKIFTLPYTKIHNNCFSCDKTKQIYDKFYS
jgi:hypothetical protein